MTSVRPATRPLSHLVLDWNGTVVADVERACRATGAVLQAHGLAPLRLAEFRRRFELPLPVFFRTTGVPSEHLYEAQAAWNRQLELSTPELSRGFHELLAACRAHEVPVGVISGADSSVITSDSARLGIGAGISWVVGSAVDKCAVLQGTTRSFGAGVAYVGDTVQDIVDARRAGALAVAYLNGYNTPEQLLAAEPDLAIESLAELIPLISGRSSP